MPTGREMGSRGITTPAFSSPKHFFPGFQDPDSDPLLQELEAEADNYFVQSFSSALSTFYRTRCPSKYRSIIQLSYSRQETSRSVHISKDFLLLLPPNDVLYGNISVSEM